MDGGSYLDVSLDCNVPFIGSNYQESQHLWIVLLMYTETEQILVAFGLNSYHSIWNLVPFNFCNNFKRFTTFHDVDQSIREIVFLSNRKIDAPIDIMYCRTTSLQVLLFSF